MAGKRPALSDAFLAADPSTPTPHLDGLCAVHGSGGVACCVIGPRARWAASGGWDGQIIVWDAYQQEPTARWSVGPKPVTAIAVTPDGTHILAGDMDGHLSQWNALHKLRETFELVHSRPIAGLAVSPSGKEAATASWDGSAQLIRLDETRERRTLRGHADVVAGCSFHPSGKHLLTWSHDGTVRFWETARAYLTNTWKLSGNRLTCGAVSPNGVHFAVSAEDGLVVFCDIERQAEVQRAAMHAEPACVGFSSDGLFLIVVSKAGELRILELPALRECARVSLNIRLNSAAVARLGDLIAFGGEDGQLFMQSVNGLGDRPMWTTAVASLEERTVERSGMLGRLLKAQTQLQRIHRALCPNCGRLLELGPPPYAAQTCPQCQRPIWLTPFVLDG